MAQKFHIGPDTQPGSFSPADVADYIAAMMRELRELANEAELKVLASLIRAAENEAETTARNLTGYGAETRRLLRKFA